MYFLDTNVVLRLLNRAAPEHDQVRRSIESLDVAREVLVIGLQILVEAWVVATRPVESNGFGWEPDVAHAALDAARGRFPIVLEDATTAVRWADLVRAAAIRGKRAHDARIAALMATHGITRLLTLNVSDFEGMASVTAVHPRVVLGE